MHRKYSSQLVQQMGILNLPNRTQKILHNSNPTSNFQSRVEIDFKVKWIEPQMWQEQNRRNIIADKVQKSISIYWREVIVQGQKLLCKLIQSNTKHNTKCWTALTLQFLTLGCVICFGLMVVIGGAKKCPKSISVFKFKSDTYCLSDFTISRNLPSKGFAEQRNKDGKGSLQSKVEQLPRQHPIHLQRFETG